ncbi:class I SAM-dependent methyltransferase [Silvibacterium acidisoli]|uniref:class I SAM-dependent methyltransferase n=1 Tax=Acidobacteriaceae bacterium ZG23-2 TaxID=2883246 RepID=UPI00406BF88C
MKHAGSVEQSFGPRAEAYLNSSVHSQGEDLRKLAELIGATKGAKVLDLGCGGGHASFAAATAAASVTAYDLTPAMLEVVAAEAKKRGLDNLHTVQGSAEQLPFENASFDWVISRYSAHHWKHVRAAMREVRRVLKPGGQVCFIDVAGGPEPLLDTHIQAVELLRDPSHVRDYTEQEWLAFFEGVKLSPTLVTSWRLPIEFSSWISRMNTSASGVDAIRTLWGTTPAEVKEYFSLGEDLSFELDVMMIQAQG